MQKAEIPPARTLASTALVSSAVLLIFELGLRLAPTNVVPGWEWIYVGAYGAYALVAMGVLWRRREGRVRE